MNFKKTIIFAIIIISIFFISSNQALALNVQELNPLKGASVQLIIGLIIKAVLGITGSFALFMMVYGGMIILTSAGDDKKVTKGKNILVWAIIGIIIVMSAYGLVNLVLTALGQGAATP